MLKMLKHDKNVLLAATKLPNLNNSTVKLQNVMPSTDRKSSKWLGRKVDLTESPKQMSLH